MCACLSAFAGTTAESHCLTFSHAETTSESPPDCFLRLAEYLGRECGEALEQRVDLFDRGRIDVEPRLVRLRKELGILHSCGERIAQRLQTVGRNAGRAGD